MKMQKLKIKQKGGRPKNPATFNFFDYSLRKNHSKNRTKTKKVLKKGAKDSNDRPHGEFLNNESQDIAREVYEVGVQLGLSFGQTEEQAVEMIRRRLKGSN